jgi:hypothetical protein
LRGEHSRNRSRGLDQDRDRARDLERGSPQKPLRRGFESPRRGSDVFSGDSNKNNPRSERDSDRNPRMDRAQTSGGWSERRRDDRAVDSSYDRARSSNLASSSPRGRANRPARSHMDDRYGGRDDDRSFNDNRSRLDRSQSRPGTGYNSRDTRSRMHDDDYYSRRGEPSPDPRDDRDDYGYRRGNRREERDGLPGLDRGRTAGGSPRRQGMPSRLRGHERDQLEARPPTASYVMCMEGLNCMSHSGSETGEEKKKSMGIVCAVLFAVTLTVSCLLWFWQKSNDDAEATDEGVGAWDFLEAMAIIGWIVCCIAFCSCVCIFSSDPDQAQSAFTVPDCGDCCNSEEKSCDICPSVSMPERCCESNPDEPNMCVACCDSCKQTMSGCSESWNSCFDNSHHEERGRNEAARGMAQAMLDRGMDRQTVSQVTGIPIGDL